LKNDSALKQLFYRLQPHVHKLLFAITAAFSLSLLSFFLNLTYQQTIDSINKNTMNEAHILASRLDATLNRVQENLNLFAEALYPEFKISNQLKKDVASYRLRIQKRMYNFPEVSRYMIFNKNGELLLNSGEDIEIQCLPVNEYFEQMSKHSSIALNYSESMQCEKSGKAMMVIYRAILDDDGNFSGLITAEINLEYFQKLFADLDVGKEGMVSIRRSDNSRLVVRWPHLPERMNNQASNIPPQIAIDSGKTEGFCRYTGKTDGIERFFAYHKTDDYPFYVLVGRAVDEQLTGWWHMTYIIISGTLATILLIGLLLYGLQKSWRLVKEKEQFNQSVMDNLPIGIAVNAVFPKVKFVYMNDRFPEIYRSDRETLMQEDSFWETVYEDEAFRESLKAKVLEDISSGDLTRMQWENIPIKHKGQPIRHISAYATPVLGQNLLISTVIDVSDRFEAERELKQSQNLMSYIIRHDPNSIVVLDRNLHFIFVSERFMKDYQLKDHNIIGKHHYEVFPDIPEKWREIHKKALQGEIFRSEEDRFVRADGSIDFTRWECRPWRDSDGSIGGIILYTEVITDRIHAQMAVRESEERLRLALAAGNQGLFDIHIPSGKVIVSAEYAQMLGWQPEEFTESLDSWFDRLHPDDSLIARKHFRGFLNQEQNEFRLECRIQVKDESWKWILRLGKIQEWDLNGNALRMLGTHTDISAMKEAEAEQEKLREQLLQAQKMESVGRLAGGVAHDFNNLLQAMMGYSEILMSKMASRDPSLAFVKEIYNSTVRAADLTRQLLAFARKQTIAPKIININQGVESMLKMLRRLIGEDIDLVWKSDANIWPVRIDPSQLDQILANLCVNARDAIGGVGKITIETANATFDDDYCKTHYGFIPGKFAALIVSDDGCGMDKATLQLIFEPFFTTKKQGEGTGLGLATIFGIVKQNEGFINVYSEPGKGSSFKIYLPRYEGETQTIETKETTKSARGYGEHILLVEDDRNILSATKKVLEDLGYIILAANSAHEAITIFSDNWEKIQLMLTDVVMPEITGRDLAEKLLKTSPDLKILYMSGYTANVIAHRGVLDDGINFISKPFSQKELANKIRQVLNS
jgi:two-component system, cell cycle sensor histidine kinase and response regulator CckA